MILETERLLLRPWKMEDLSVLHELTKDPDVGPNAGWPPHLTMEESEKFLKESLQNPNIFCICDRTTGTVYGEISFMKVDEDIVDIGFWIGKPYWNHGIVSEAFETLIDYVFEELNMQIIQCRYFIGNNVSKHIQEKFGFRYITTEFNVYWEPLQVYKDIDVLVLTRSEHIRRKIYMKLG